LNKLIPNFCISCTHDRYIYLFQTLSNGDLDLEIK